MPPLAAVPFVTVTPGPVPTGRIHHNGYPSQDIARRRASPASVRQVWQHIERLAGEVPPRGMTFIEWDDLT